MATSFFLYMHLAFSMPGYIKIGKSITFYSTLRPAIRKGILLGIDYGWMGYPEHIAFLEEKLKEHFSRWSSTALTGNSGQTELFKITYDQAIAEVNRIIDAHNLQIKQVSSISPATPYTAANSGECPLGTPSESKAFEYHMELLANDVDLDANTKIKRNTFEDWFEFFDPNICADIPDLFE